MDEKQLRILIETILDERGAKAAVDALNKVKEKSKDVGREAQQTTAGFDSMGKSVTNVLGTIGKISAVLTATTAPLIISAKQYVASVNMAESTSRQWLKTQYDIEQSQLRVNRINAEKTLPLMQAYSSVMEKIAGFAEKNPTLFVAGEAAAGALGSGVVINAVSKLLTRGAAGGLSGVMGSGATAATGTTLMDATTGTASGVAGGTSIAGMMTLVAGTFATVGLPTLIISGGMKALLNYLTTGTDWGRQIVSNSQKKSGLTDEQVEQANKSQNPAITSAVIQAQNQGEFKDATPKWVQDLNNWVRKLLGGGQAQTDSATGNAVAGAGASSKGGEFVTTQRLWQLREYQRQEQYVQEDYDRQRFVMNRDFNRQLMYTDQDFQRQRGYALRDFNINMAFTEKMFYLQRSIAAREFNISLSRSEEDYRIARRRAQEDHNFSLKQIMLSGDALQYYYSQRQFKIDERRAEEDYQRQRARSIADFNRQQGDAEYQFQLQRQQTLLQFTIQLADQQKEFDIQRSRQLYQYDLQLKDMDFQFRRERTRRWDAFVENILPEILTEAKQRALIEGTLTTAMLNQFNTMMSHFITDWNGYWAGVNAASHVGTSPSTGRNFGGYAEGGYTTQGMAMLHNNEFVLTADTTRTAERAAQGTLTQDKIAQMLTNGSQQLQYVDNRQFSRGLSIEEKTMLRNELRQMVAEAFAR